MRPLFDDKPLTSDEIADLTAFFASVAGDDSGGGIDWLIIGGLGGLIVLLGSMAVLRRRPPQTYNQRLRSKQ